MFGYRKRRGRDSNPGIREETGLAILRRTAGPPRHEKRREMNFKNLYINYSLSDKMIELEKTYLAKYLPEGLKKCESKEILDIYLPTSSRHPNLRIRKNGEKYEITKKTPIKGDASQQKEETTTLTEGEFEELNSRLEGKRTHKIRYRYPWQGNIAEIDVFQGELKGLVLVDFEFSSEEEKNKFQMSDFCLVEVTHKEFTAGGMLCGKSYEDIDEELKKLGYKKI